MPETTYSFKLPQSQIIGLLGIVIYIVLFAYLPWPAVIAIALLCALTRHEHEEVHHLKE